MAESRTWFLASVPRDPQVRRVSLSSLDLPSEDRAWCSFSEPQPAGESSTMAQPGLALRDALVCWCVLRAVEHCTALCSWKCVRYWESMSKTDSRRAKPRYAVEDAATVRFSIDPHIPLNVTPKVSTKCFTSLEFPSLELFFGILGYTHFMYNAMQNFPLFSTWNFCRLSWCR